jgi:pimeloyl-ACP methyl ester carboxylesterase
MIILRHTIIGNGKKHIVLLHDLLSDKRNYKSIHEYINIEEYTYIFVDLRGYGSSKDIEGNYTCDEASNDVINLIKHLNLKSVCLLGHSMSTLIAQKIAMDAPTLINNLILITPIGPQGIKIPLKSQNKLLDDLAKNEGNIEQIVNNSSKRYNQRWRDNRIKDAYDSSLLHARVGYMHMYLTSDISNTVKNIQCPINIIVGKHDLQIFSYRTVDRIMTNYYANFEIHECDQAGHYPMLECPVYFVSKLEAFCSSQ